MIRKATTLLAALALWAALPAASQAEGAHGCACLSNRTNMPIHFQYRWGEQAWQTRTLNVGMTYKWCGQAGGGPWLHFQLDRDAGPGTAMTDYSIQRINTTSQDCAHMHPSGLYYVAYQANTNNQFLIIHRQAKPH